MQIPLYDPEAKKKAANLSVNGDLLRQAREHHINLSRALEQKLAEMLLEKRRREWKEENRGAIDAYNRRVEEHGVFSDGVRTF
jgi:antitoxin CcdA